MMRYRWRGRALAVSMVSWFEPLPALDRQSFAPHIVLHITVVLVAGKPARRQEPAR